MRHPFVGTAGGPDDVPQHIEDIVAAKPAAVWLQSGIRSPAAEEAFARAGLKVGWKPSMPNLGRLLCLCAGHAGVMHLSAAAQQSKTLSSPLLGWDASRLPQHESQHALEPSRMTATATETISISAASPTSVRSRLLQCCPRAGGGRSMPEGGSQHGRVQHRKCTMSSIS